MNNRKIHLLVESVVKLVLLLISIGVILFGSAGTLRFINGWIAIGMLLVPVIISGAFFYFKNPEMLKRRVTHREQNERQKALIAMCTVIFALGLVASGLSYRFSFLTLPVFCLPIGFVIYLFSLILYCLAYSANPFLSKAVLIQDAQYVVDTGIYGKLRHPFYLATTLFYFSISIALNSILTMAVFVLYIPVLNRRIVLEEAYLKSELPGYEEYMKKVPYRLIPNLW